jgi:hypothetical protein
LPLPASGSNDWANAGDAMPAAAIAAIRAILEMVIMVFPWSRSEQGPIALSPAAEEIEFRCRNSITGA